MFSSYSVVRRLIESNFIRSVATMLTGNVAAQFIGLLAAPVITRLYSPEQFGIMVFIQAVAGAFSVIACFRYRSAIVLPKEDSEGYNLFILSMFTVIITSSLLMLFILLFIDPIANITGFQGYKNYLLFIPLVVACSSVKDVLVYFHTRLKKFRIIAISTFLVPFVTASTKIIAALLFTASAFWLIVGNALGSIAAAMFLVYFIVGLFPEIKNNVNLANMKIVARNYRRFPQYNMPTNFVNNISQSLPVFLLTFFYSNEVVGFYGLASLILKRPVSLMSQSLGKVFLQKSSEIQNQGGDLYISLKKTTLGLVAIGFLPFFLLTLGGKWIFGYIFGINWAEAGLYAQVLAPWLFIALINRPSNQIYIVKQKLRFLMYFNYLLIIVRLFSLYLGYLIFHDALYTVLLFSISGVVMNLYFIFNAFVITRKGN
ncbi:oligosaccharide flippase family protein [Deltaproteobacteria bacterium IMCC39524]|nr:oligosaccharide flippase family protein [Deltaproteobacteria bacterium IMCC39524]